MPLPILVAGHVSLIVLTPILLIFVLPYVGAGLALLLVRWLAAILEALL